MNDLYLLGSMVLFSLNSFLCSLAISKTGTSAGLASGFAVVTLLVTLQKSATIEGPLVLGLLPAALVRWKTPAVVLLFSIGAALSGAVVHTSVQSWVLLLGCGIALVQDLGRYFWIGSGQPKRPFLSDLIWCAAFQTATLFPELKIHPVEVWFISGLLAMVVLPSRRMLTRLPKPSTPKGERNHFFLINTLAIAIGGTVPFILNGNTAGTSVASGRVFVGLFGGLQIAASFFLATRDPVANSRRFLASGLALVFLSTAGMAVIALAPRAISQILGPVHELIKENPLLSCLIAFFMPISGQLGVTVKFRCDIKAVAVTSAITGTIGGSLVTLSLKTGDGRAFLISWLAFTLITIVGTTVCLIVFNHERSDI